MTDGIPERERRHDRGGKPLPRGSFILKVLEALEAGASRAGAAAYAGIHRDTLRAWINSDPELKTLIEQAEDLAEANYLQVVQHEATGRTKESWKAAAWLLERRKPELYGQRRTLEVTGEVDVRIARAAAEAGLDPHEVMAEVERILADDSTP